MRDLIAAIDFISERGNYSENPVPVSDIHFNSQVTMRA